MSMKRVFSVLILFLTGIGVCARKPVKVACIGNSITYGIGVKAPETDSYPAQLQRLLGPGYEVGRFGKPGATLLRKAYRPLMAQEEFRQAMQFAADIAVIHLGVNDTDPRAWPNYRDDFVRDYLALIDSCRAANPSCRIFMARITPLSHRHRRFESGTRDWHAEIQQAIETVARVSGAFLIDFHTPLYVRPHLMPDAIHPDEEGAELMARVAYSAITGDYGGLQLPMPYTDNMVLQRNRPIPIHGRANAGEPVAIRLGALRAETVTDSSGQWRVTLPPLPAGGPYELKVQTRKRTCTCRNVLIGEVWLCSGQSNMAFPLRAARTGPRDTPSQEIANIRLLNMKGFRDTDATSWRAAELDSVNRGFFFGHPRWTACTPMEAIDFSAVAFYFGKMLGDSLNVPIGLICNAVGGSPIEAWIDRGSLEYHFPALLRDWLQNDFIQDWVRERAALNLKGSTRKLQRHPYEPCYLFETGILPLEHFPVNGVIWYQGESNAHNKDAHERLFPLLVNSWRTYWDADDLPFYYAQLSSMARPSWPWFRDSQRRLLQKVPHTGMAVTSDIGDSLDVHPRRKQEVGERLARWALHDVYGFQHVTVSGPLFRDVTFRDGAAYVRFDYGEGLQSADGAPLRTFELAEVDGLYEPATAEVTAEGVRVSSPHVRHPRYIRYGWQPFTRANLVNGAGLPASTFRSE